MNSLKWTTQKYAWNSKHSESKIIDAKRRQREQVKIEWLIDNSAGFCVWIYFMDNYGIV